MADLAIPWNAPPTVNNRASPDWGREIDLDGHEFSSLTIQSRDCQSRFSWRRLLSRLRLSPNSVLALTVVAFHANLLGWDHAGDLAVQVFFALSGWLIGGILIRSRPTQLARFYFNRAARIWVPYFAALAILIIASLFRDHVITKKWYEFVFYMLTFVYNLAGVTQLAADQGPLTGTGSYVWSVCAEEQFYLVAPFLLVVLPFGQSLLVWVGMAIALLASPFSAMFAAITLGVLAALNSKALCRMASGLGCCRRYGSAMFTNACSHVFRYSQIPDCRPFHRSDGCSFICVAWDGSFIEGRRFFGRRFLSSVSQPLARSSRCYTSIEYVSH